MLNYQMLVLFVIFFQFVQLDISLTRLVPAVSTNQNGNSGHIFLSELWHWSSIFVSTKIIKKLRKKPINYIGA